MAMANRSSSPCCPVATLTHHLSSKGLSTLSPLGYQEEVVGPTTHLHSNLHISILERCKLGSSSSSHRLLGSVDLHNFTAVVRLKLVLRLPRTIHLSCLQGTSLLPRERRE